MRKTLSTLLACEAEKDPRVIVLSGDHGHDVLKPMRLARPDQYINAGICEPAMIGYAAGLALTGFRPIIYGAAAFVPMRVVEQIKLDLCHPKAPVLMIGDGAGLVFSGLGNSHICNEDVAVLRALPNIRIYSPGDALELEACFREAVNSNGPAYVRIGKGDLPAVNISRLTTMPKRVACAASQVCLAATGAMLRAARELAEEHRFDCISIPRIKPITKEDIWIFRQYDLVIAMEEHSRYGGLFSALSESFCDGSSQWPRLQSIATKDQFLGTTGSYHHALREHGLDYEQLSEQIARLG